MYRIRALHCNDMVKIKTLNTSKNTASQTLNSNSKPKKNHNNASLAHINLFQAHDKYKSLYITTEAKLNENN